MNKEHNIRGIIIKICNIIYFLSDSLEICSVDVK